jgi:hypothetical protein
MIDGLAKPYGLIRFVKRGDQVGYRADRCDDRGSLTGLVGYYRKLKPATAAVHLAFIRSHGATGAPNGTGSSRATDSIRGLYADWSITHSKEVFQPALGTSTAYRTPRSSACRSALTGPSTRSLSTTDGTSFELHPATAC